MITEWLPFQRRTFSWKKMDILWYNIDCIVWYKEVATADQLHDKTREVHLQAYKEHHTPMGLPINGNHLDNTPFYICKAGGVILAFPFCWVSSTCWLLIFVLPLNQLRWPKLVITATETTWVKESIECCHSKGVEVLVDAVHAPGQVKTDMAEMDPDYYAGEKSCY